jgi:RNA recognition motif-containing protein
MTFYVSNLAAETTRAELLEAFRPHGEVASLSLPAEGMKGGRAQGVHRGYGFVVMRNRVEAAAALAALNGRPVHGRAMSVQIAYPKQTPHYVS